MHGLVACSMVMIQTGRSCQDLSDNQFTEQWLHLLALAEKHAASAMRATSHAAATHVFTCSRFRQVQNSVACLIGYGSLRQSPCLNGSAFAIMEGGSGMCLTAGSETLSLPCFIKPLLPTD